MSKTLKREFAQKKVVKVPKRDKGSKTNMRFHFLREAEGE